MEGRRVSEARLGRWREEGVEVVLDREVFVLDRSQADRLSTGLGFYIQDLEKGGSLAG